MNLKLPLTLVNITFTKEINIVKFITWLLTGCNRCGILQKNEKDVVKE